MNLLRKLLITVTLLSLTANTFADCRDLYQAASSKRNTRDKLIAISIAGMAPVGVFVGISGVVIVTVMAIPLGYGVGVSADVFKNTFTKGSRVLNGDTDLALRRVSKLLDKLGYEIDTETYEFRAQIAEVVKELNANNTLCPYRGFDKNFKDKFEVFNFREFTKIVTDEYVKKHLLH